VAARLAYVLFVGLSLRAEITRKALSRHDGPELAWLVNACKAPNGTYWALQSWQTALPNLGMAPWLRQQKTWWLRLSHWTGPLAQLDVYTDWIYGGRFQEAVGRYTYNGQGVRGFGTTRVGAPTDNYGRLLFLDTFNSAYGKGWLREGLVRRLGRPECSATASTGGTRGSAATRIRARPEPQASLRRRRAVPVTAAGPGVTPT
jgi:hypothetical protein